MARRWCFVLLTLIAVDSFTNSSPSFISQAAQADKDDPDSSESDADAVVADTEETFVLTKGICIDGHRSTYLGNLCCTMNFDADDITEDCAIKLSGGHPTTKNEKIIHLSKLSECIYKRRRYIKDDHTLNIGHIKADAAKLKDPLARKYMVDMYRTCGRVAKKEISEVEKMAKTSLETKHQCPHFRWSGEERDAAKCKGYSRECNALMKK